MHDQIEQQIDYKWRIVARGVLYHPVREALLVMRCQLEDRSWTLCPGGIVLPHETTSLGLIRCFGEETGIKISPQELVGMYQRFVDDINQLDLYLFVRADRANWQGDLRGGVQTSPWAIGLEWCSLSDLGDVNFYPREIVRHLQALKRRRAPLPAFSICEDPPVPQATLPFNER